MQNVQISLLVLLTLYASSDSSYTYEYYNKAMDYLHCFSDECCTRFGRAQLNIRELENNLTTKLYGQPIVLPLIQKLIHHRQQSQPRKALFLSFNGTPGIGKSFVVKMIMDAFYTDGKYSEFVRYYYTRRHFHDELKVKEYQEDLAGTIQATVKKCSRSLFVIDEANYAPKGLLDAIKPFLDDNSFIDGVDYTKAVFIIISNSGSNVINQVLENVWHLGKDRESIDGSDLQDQLEKYLFNSKGDGLSSSAIIKHGLVSMYVPFLPLEKHHVELCFKDYLESIGMPSDRNTINRLVSKMKFKKSYGHNFAEHGCRKIESYVNAF